MNSKNLKLKYFNFSFQLKYFDLIHKILLQNIIEFIDNLQNLLMLSYFNEDNDSDFIRFNECEGGSNDNEFKGKSGGHHGVDASYVSQSKLNNFNG